MTEVTAFPTMFGSILMRRLDEVRCVLEGFDVFHIDSWLCAFHLVESHLITTSMQCSGPQVPIYCCEWKSLYAYPMGRHINSNFCRSVSVRFARPSGFELRCAVDCLHQVCSFGKPRDSSSRCCFVRWWYAVETDERTKESDFRVLNFLFCQHSSRHGRGVQLAVLFDLVWVFLLCVLQSGAFRNGSVRRSGRSDNKVTWLILPVVICLSQRLSHACLSINNFIL